MTDHRHISAKKLDIVMIPHGGMHWIADKIDRQLVPSEIASHVCELGNPLFQQGELTHRIICGLVHYEEELKHPLIQSLPPVLHFSQIEISDPI